MMADNRGEEAFRLLEEIHEAVVGSDAQYIPPDWPRKRVEPGTKIYNIMATVKENAPIDSGKVAEITGYDNATRTLSTLYYVGYINRQKNREEGPVVYTGLTEWGRQVMADSPSESAVQESVVANTEPWHVVDLSERMWYIFRAIHDYNGHPSTSDIAAKRGEEVESVSAVFHRLWKKGYVSRPEKQPYVYWLTEKGEGVLQEGLSVGGPDD